MLQADHSHIVSGIQADYSHTVLGIQKSYYKDQFFGKVFFKLDRYASLGNGGTIWVFSHDRRSGVIESLFGTGPRTLKKLSPGLILENVNFSYLELKIAEVLISKGFCTSSGSLLVYNQATKEKLILDKVEDLMWILRGSHLEVDTEKIPVGVINPEFRLGKEWTNYIRTKEQV